MKPEWGHRVYGVWGLGFKASGLKGTDYESSN